MSKVYTMYGSEAVCNKVVLSGIVPLNIGGMVNCDTPNLVLFSTHEYRIMRWIVKEPFIKNEYYVSDSMVDVLDYKNRYDLPHSFMAVGNGRERGIVTVLGKCVSIVYQRKRKIVLEFSSKEEARRYWEFLQPLRELVDDVAVKEYLSKYNRGYFKSL